MLFDLLLHSLFEHRIIHADPNRSNFSFLANGRVVVYDYGCVKSVPPPIVKDYRAGLHLPRFVYNEIYPLRQGDHHGNRNETE